ncbi:MAG: FtsX-like permease family protein [Bacteroidota bacterium]
MESRLEIIMRFDLEKAIKQWRSQLRKFKGFEDADIEELEDHLRSKIEEFNNQGKTDQEAFEMIISADYGDLQKLSSSYYQERVVSLSPWLLLNYLKIGWRSIRTTKLYFFINLFGLVIGLISFFYITAYLNNELNYDNFHENGNQIYRVNNLFDRASGKIYYPLIPPAFGPAIKDNFSEVEYAARMRYAYNVLMQHEDKSFYEDRVFFAEPDYLKMHSFEWLQGDEQSALKKLNTIILTKSTAVKYFGDSNPIGKVISYDGELNLTVVGIIADIPEKSHITFDFLISFESFKPGPGSLEPMTSWKWVGFLTYIQLKPNSNIPLLEEKLADLFSQNNNSKVNKGVKIELQSLPDIYLTSSHLSNPQGGLFKTNNQKNLVSLGIIALLILAISFFNYFNITAALIRTRSKEFGIRRLFGSTRKKVFTQMAMETLLVSGLSTMVGWVSLFIFSQYDLIILNQENVTVLLIASAIIITIFTLLSSVLFGGIFSAYPIMSLLSGKALSSARGRFSFGKIVLLFQFGISASLVLISLIVINQLNYFSQKELGYQSDGVLVSKFRSIEMHNRKDVFSEALLKNSAVSAVSFGPSLDGSSSGNPLRLNEWPEDEVIQTLIVKIFEDPDNFIGNIACELDFVMKRVFKDFHYQSLHHEIGPLALKIWLGPPRNVLIRYESENIIETLNSIENTWENVFADNAFPFDYQLLDDQISAMYAREKEFSMLLKIFTSLTIFIAVLGLFGLSSINIHQKTKPIAIRRVLGAEILQIGSFVSKKYLLIASLGIAISLPVSYFIAIEWLNNYAYRISLDGRFSVITIAVVLGITILTLGFQIYKVMTVNPAKILKDE